MVTNRRQRLFRRRKQARPSELVAAAQEIFFRSGFAAARLEDVAAKAGVSKGTIYLYFKNKEVLFNEVVRTGLAPAVTSVEALAADTCRPPRERLDRFLAVWKRVAAETPLTSLMKLLAAEAGAFPEVAEWFSGSVLHPARMIMIGIVRSGIDSGDFRPSDPEMTADLLLSPLCACAFADVLSAMPSSDRFLDYAYDRLARSL